MEQRRLRPGDSLDDYCPRERRLTDHVVVAVVDDVVKQTRCNACETEHVYKDGKVPPRRAKQGPMAPTLGPRVPDPVPEEAAAGNGDLPEPVPNLVVRPERKPAKGRRGVVPATPAPPPVGPSPSTPATEQEPLLAQPADDVDDEGPVHRRLIRATLPRPEGQPPARPIPEFTMRQPGARGGFGKFDRFGGKGGNRFGGQGGQGGRVRPDGQGGQRAGASAQGPHGDARGRSKGGRSRGPRFHHKKSR